MNRLIPYYRAGYFSPQIGRFISRDPLRNAALTQGPNLYWYAQNNPANAVDPRGLDTCCPCCETERQKVADDTTALTQLAKTVAADQVAVAQAATAYAAASGALTSADLYAGAVCASMFFDDGATAVVCARAIAAQIAATTAFYATQNNLTGAQNRLGSDQQLYNQEEQTYRSDVKAYQACLTANANTQPGCPCN